ncbi:MAG: N-acetyl-gamma-glutamyl-phosphate reductase [Bacteroidales bacterium]|nr:N-acetyl-gamma-glutamyl-phosphate reductase [Bacteroidales bacterium]
MIRAGIIGAAGYTAGELIRILVNHPEAEIVFAHSESNAGNRVCDVHGGLIGDTDLRFSDSFDLGGVDVLFLCAGHGRSEAFWKEHRMPAGLKVIDLAQDFRDEREGYVYGLPEWRFERIKGASRIANPGCFATAIQLALLPLAQAGLLDGEVDVTAVTGSTGAGVKPSLTSHFSWRTDNISSYKVFEHQHLLEICRNLDIDRQRINFVPIRGDFARGIFATAHTVCGLSEEQAVKLYEDFYRDAAFTFVSPLPVDLKQAVNTNKCIIHLEKHGSRLVVTSVIDNLLKGASGQAVQNMNIIFGLPQTSGLKLKASAF